MIIKNLSVKLHNILTTFFEIIFGIGIIFLYVIRYHYVNDRQPSGTTILELLLILLPFISYGTFKIVTQQILEEKSNKMIENLKIIGLRD